MSSVDPSSVRMFFYGSLKRDGANDHYCAGGEMTSEAWVENLIFDLPEGLPALVVPQTTILAVGTADCLGDVRAAKALDTPGPPRPKGPSVRGELYTFRDPEERLTVLDRLEDFDPKDPSSPYRRVVVPVTLRHGGVVPAWAYAVRHAREKHLPGGRWPDGS